MEPSTVIEKKKKNEVYKSYEIEVRHKLMEVVVYADNINIFNASKVSKCHLIQMKTKLRV